MISVGHMDFGLTIPSRGPLATRATIGAIAERAEQLGFRHMAVSDHIVVPRSIASRYPYAASGAFPGSATGDCFDQFTLLSFLAAITSTARLISSVTIVPHRGAVLTAKMIATLDVLAEGRFTFGVGAGWMREEFEALGAPPFAERGRVTDEYLAACKVLWTQDDPVFDGRFVRFSGISFLPKPIQQPHPPIWIGGESPAALRRVARLGDAWYPIGTNPRHPLNTVARLRDGIDRLRRQAEEQGRDPDAITLTYYSNWFDETKPASLDAGQRQLLTGSAEEIATDIRALGELGVRHLILNFQRDTPQTTLASMQHFVDEIVPRSR